MLNIGSNALQYHNIHLRTPKDHDFVCTYEEFEKHLALIKQNLIIKSIYPTNKGKKMIVLSNNRPREYEIAWPESTAEQLIKLVQEDKDTKKVINGTLAPSLDMLYTLKMSHRFLKNSPHFAKTMDDILFLKSKGATIRPEWLDFYKAREKETYDYGHPKLNTNKDEFFDKSHGIVYQYDHDSIHRAMAHMDKPAYEYYKPESSEVMCSKDMFFAVDEQIRLYGGLEESYILALERSQIPFKDKNIPPEWSFNKALMKVCTSITSGWFREFCWDSYYKIKGLYDPNYVNRFWQSVEEGKVQKL